jgi:alkanesulfonate monooxygenase SsuD/methylene tetrahydromethanopterin reductase-like flavin-dependent oxidoreductase (luciferase family)
MGEAWTCHPWVANARGRVTFSVQPFPGVDGPEPGKQLLRIGRMAEELGFEALCLGDHPAFAPECWAHLAALAVTTTRIRLGPMVAAAGYQRRC